MQVIQYRIETANIATADTLKLATDAKAIDSKIVISDDAKTLPIAEAKIDISDEKVAIDIETAINEAIKTSPSGYYKIHECNHDIGMPCDSSTVTYVSWGDGKVAVPIAIAKEPIVIDEPIKVVK
jgi:hypothetical protein